MASKEPMYHAPMFEPTVDELEALKQLEMGQRIHLPEALKQHLSGRLLEWGCVTKTPQGEFALTDAGRKWIRRQDG